MPCRLCLLQGRHTGAVSDPGLPAEHQASPGMVRIPGLRVQEGGPVSGGLMPSKQPTLTLCDLPARAPHAAVWDGSAAITAQAPARPLQLIFTPARSPVPYTKPTRSPRDFVMVKEIGTGNASTVWYAFCKKTSTPLAIKTYKKRKLSPLNRRQVRNPLAGHGCRGAWGWWGGGDSPAAAGACAGSRSPLVRAAAPFSATHTLALVCLVSTWTVC